jgi:arylsulfatase A-like enzyme
LAAYRADADAFARACWRGGAWRAVRDHLPRRLGCPLRCGGNLRKNCGATGQVSAALVADLKRRGLLDDTLVILAGEFGRKPMVESSTALGRRVGRDHHPQAFTIWLAGGGLKRGLAYNVTDELGFHVVEQPVHMHDLQATILHLLGLDHERLIFRHAGRDFRRSSLLSQLSYVPETSTCWKNWLADRPTDSADLPY